MNDQNKQNIALALLEEVKQHGEKVEKHQEVMRKHEKEYEKMLEEHQKLLTAYSVFEQYLPSKVGNIVSEGTVNQEDFYIVDVDEAPEIPYNAEFEKPKKDDYKKPKAERKIVNKDIGNILKELCLPLKYGHWHKTDEYFQMAWQRCRTLTWHAFYRYLGNIAMSGIRVKYRKDKTEFCRVHPNTSKGLNRRK